MTDQKITPVALSLHTQVFVALGDDGEDKTPVDIIATSAQELLDTIAALKGGAPAKPKPKAEPKAEEKAPAPKAEEKPTQTAPPEKPSEETPAATAPQEDATPSAPATVEVTVSEVLDSARKLLTAGHKDVLKKILDDHGCTNVSTAPDEALPGIKAAIDAAI